MKFIEIRTTCPPRSTIVHRYKRTDPPITIHFHFPIKIFHIKSKIFILLRTYTIIIIIISSYRPYSKQIKPCNAAYTLNLQPHLRSIKIFESYKIIMLKFNFAFSPHVALFNLFLMMYDAHTQNLFVFNASITIIYIDTDRLTTFHCSYA